MCNEEKILAVVEVIDDYMSGMLEYTKSETNLFEYFWLNDDSTYPDLGQIVSALEHATKWSKSYDWYQKVGKALKKDFDAYSRGHGEDFFSEDSSVYAGHYVGDCCFASYAGPEEIEEDVTHLLNGLTFEEVEEVSRRVECYIDYLRDEYSPNDTIYAYLTTGGIGIKFDVPAKYLDIPEDEEEETEG